MTRREQLQEQYEDALFALLMDDLAAIEGQAALEENERLKSEVVAYAGVDADSDGSVTE